jgi:RNA polymerase sigma-70 factor (ECF subfamily)
VEASDDDLMGRVAAGDAHACQQVVERHLGRILGLAARTLGDRTEAEDVAQETFLRLWSHAAEWRPGEAKLTTWLHRVAINLCRDRHARRRETQLDETADPPDPQADVVGALQDRDLAGHVRAEIMRLTEAQRLALTLCHYQGLRNTEAAEVMGIGVEALESLLARARRTLRERLRSVAAELLAEE